MAVLFVILGFMFWTLFVGTLKILFNKNGEIETLESELKFQIQASRAENECKVIAYKKLYEKNRKIAELEQHVQTRGDRITRLEEQIVAAGKNARLQQTRIETYELQITSLKQSILDNQDKIAMRDNEIKQQDELIDEYKKEIDLKRVVINEKINHHHKQLVAIRDTVQGFLNDS